MKTSIEHIRGKTTELEARIADLRIAERELEALDATPASRRKPKAKAKRTTMTDGAIADTLNRSGPLPLAELADQIIPTARELDSLGIPNQPQM
jgi:hypothetical protein